MQINRVFDEWSSEYTEKMVRWVPFYLETINAVISGLPEGFQPDSVVDLGCGNGNLSSLIKDQFPGSDCLLLDASEEMLNLCKERFAGFAGMKFTQALFQDLDFPHHSFDLVTAGYALHHLNANEKQDLFKKIYKWLKPEGCFSFCDLHISRSNETEYNSFLKDWEKEAKNRKTPDDEWNYLMEHHLTYDFPDGPEDTKNWLIEAGFNNIKVTWQQGYWMTLLARKQVKT